MIDEDRPAATGLHRFVPQRSLSTLQTRISAQAYGGLALHVGRLLSGEVVNRACRFAATVVLARALSTSDFGLVNVGISVSGIALIATSLGLPDQGARDVAVSPERAGWLAGRVISLRVLAIFVVSLIGVPIAILFWPGRALWLVMAALMAIFMAAQTDWLGRGLERMSLVAASIAVGGVTVLAGVLIVAAAKPTPAGALGAFACAEAAVAVFLWAKLHRVSTFELGLRGAGPMLRRARPLALSSLAIYIFYANFDTIILAATHSDRIAGLYSAPYRLFLVLNLVGPFAAFSMLPTLARLSEEHDEDEARRLVHAALVALASYGLAVLGLVEIAGGSILSLVFGHAFRAAAGTFVLLVSGVAWYAIGYPTGYSLIARGENARFLRGAAAASVLNIALDLALIPPLGMRGAGLATMVAFDVAAIMWLWGRGLVSRAVVQILLALTVSSAVAAVLVFDQQSTTVAGFATLILAAALAVRSFQA